MRYLALILLVSYGCIGTDIVEEFFSERLNITSSISALKVGESYQLMAELSKSDGTSMEVPVEWTSTDPSIISVQPDGLIMALMPGKISVIASYQEWKDTLMIEAGSTTVEAPMQRTGTFQGVNNYSVNGDFTLSDTGSGLELSFSSNFSANNGPGLHVYLSNQQNSVSGGIDLGVLKQNSGSQTYPVPSSVTMDTYNHVIVYCKPFSVVFGFGVLN